MNLAQFIDKYKNRRLDWDNAYRCQCVDVVKAYSKLVNGIELNDFNWAACLADETTFPWYKRLKPWPSVALLPWDIIIKSPTKADGMNWHTGVVVKVYATGYDMFDQIGMIFNWRSLVWGQKCKTRRYLWDNIQDIRRLSNK